VSLTTNSLGLFALVFHRVFRATYGFCSRRKIRELQESCGRPERNHEGPGIKTLYAKGFMKTEAAKNISWISDERRPSEAGRQSKRRRVRVNAVLAQY